MIPQIIIKNFLLFFQLSIRLNGKSINFEDNKISKSTFYKNKKLFNIHDLDANKILVICPSYGTKNSFKYFIGYNDDDVIRPLYIKLSKMIAYVKHFDSNKTMSSKVSDNKLLKKSNKIWEKINNLMNIELDSEPAYGDNGKYIKTKIKMYEDRVNRNFQGKKIPKENVSYKCLSLIMLDSVIRVNKKYYPQTLLEECKYVIRKNKMENLINDDLDLSSSDESDNETGFYLCWFRRY